MVLYADMFFALNFCFDFLVLLCCGKLLFRKIKLYKIIISSVIGGVYSVFAVALDIGGLFALLVNLVVSLLMLYICIDFHGIIGLLKCVLIFYTVSFLFGGCVSAFVNIFSALCSDLSATKPDINFFHLVFLAFICFFLSMILGRLFVKKNSVESALLGFSVNGKVFEFKLLCDSGNLLRDPYSGLEVAIIKSSFLKKITGFDADNLSPEEIICRLNNTFSSMKMRIIPIFTSSGKRTLLAFHPQDIYIRSNDKKYATDMIIAVDSGEAAYDGFDGTLPYALCNNLK